MSIITEKAIGGQATRLVHSPAAREVVPAVPGESARWHVHDYPGPFCRWNYHPEYEVHLIQRSRGRCIVGDHIGAFGPGQLVLVGSNLPHHWISDIAAGDVVRERDVVLQFHPRWLAECQRLIPELRAANGLLKRAARGLEFGEPAAGAGAAELLAIGRSSGLQRLGHLVALLDVLGAAAEAGAARPLATPWVPPIADDRAAELVDRVLSQVAGGMPGLTQSDAAALVGMSESAFSRFFTRASGQTFSDTVRKMRMAHARQLLEHTDLPVAGVASRVGYQNLSNFNRQFLRMHEVTPTAYRKAERRPPSKAVDAAQQS